MHRDFEIGMFDEGEWGSSFLIAAYGGAYTQTFLYASTLTRLLYLHDRMQE